MIIFDNNNYNNKKWKKCNNRQITYRGREDKKENKTNTKTKNKNNNTSLLHPNYEKTILSNMHRKHDVH